MKKVTTTAQYHMSQGDLILTCDTKADFMERDAAAFVTRGVGAKRVALFREQTRNAAKLPSDTQFNQQKQEYTDAVAKQRLVVESGMATVMSQVAIVNNDRSSA